MLLSLSFGRDKHDVKPEMNEFPKYLPLLIKLQLKMFTDEQLKSKLGLKGGQVNTARKKLNNKRSYEVKDNVCKLGGDIGSNEMKVIQEVLSVLNCSDAIQFDVLFEELKGLIGKEIPGVDLTPLDDNRKGIAGILMCLLNNINFSLMDGVRAKTVLNVNAYKTAHVYGQYYIVHEKEPFNEVTVVSSVFDLGYDVADIFDDHVTDENVENGDIEFNFDLGKIVHCNHSV
uniref:Orf19 n=1 Tax=Serratia marcescens TaxID=615 RepID=A0A7S6YKU1_SERMA|nr:Orf19 [Serratia marcescens]